MVIVFCKISLENLSPQKYYSAGLARRIDLLRKQLDQDHRNASGVDVREFFNECPKFQDGEENDFAMLEEISAAIHKLQKSQTEFSAEITELLTGIEELLRRIIFAFKAACSVWDSDNDMPCFRVFVNYEAPESCERQSCSPEDSLIQISRTPSASYTAQNDTLNPSPLSAGERQHTFWSASGKSIADCPAPPPSPASWGKRHLS